jgi:signal transduction histidine kinase
MNYIHPEDRQMVIERHSKRLKGEKVPNTYSLRLRNRDGEELWAELNVVLVNWEGKPATLNFLRDITLQKQLETQFQQIRRLEALGTLAGGIAHDFNNLLMGIQGRTSLMMMNADFSHLHYEDLKGIEDIVKSGVDLTKQLLGFGRKGKYEVKPTDLNKLVHTSSQMFGRTKKEIKIHAKYQKNIWAAEVDRGQIEQVLLNLYVNAWQAMPGGGELYLQTENVTLDESYSNSYEIKPGRYVKISVTDTGVGMDEATKERIFEPFFTTKQMGRGMGLGLASAYGIVKNHEGILNVYSERGKGTTFNICLPACEKEIIDEKKPIEEFIRGTETVLLVDDEDIIVDIGKKNLEKLGYKVITARDGKEAVELYKKNQGNIDIVVLDMIMPEMGGGETYDKLREIDPDVKVILSSGYSLEGQASEILKRGCDGFIQKPFRMKQLSRKINEVLEK